MALDLEMTPRFPTLPSRAMISSDMPSAKYSSSAAPRFSNGRTTIIGRAVCAGAAFDATGAGAEEVESLAERPRNQAAPMAISTTTTATGSHFLNGPVTVAGAGAASTPLWEIAV